jgi:hypothetical protein
MRTGTRRRLLALVVSVAAAGIVAVAGVAAASPSSPAGAPSASKSAQPGPTGKEPGPKPTGTCPEPTATGKTKPAPPSEAQETEAMARDLARVLHIPLPEARTAMRQVQALNRAGGGVDPSSPAFARIARELGITPQHLADALRQVKQDMAPTGPCGKPKPTSKPTGNPTGKPTPTDKPTGKPTATPTGK